MTNWDERLWSSVVCHPPCSDAIDLWLLKCPHLQHRCSHSLIFRFSRWATRHASRNSGSSSPSGHFCWVLAVLYCARPHGTIPIGALAITLAIPSRGEHFWYFRCRTTALAYLSSGHPVYSPSSVLCLLNCRHPRNWKGTNILGYSLMMARAALGATAVCDWIDDSTVAPPLQPRQSP